MGGRHKLASGEIMISVTEIILIAVGILAVILGYLIPAGSEKMNDADLSMNEQKVSEMVRRAIQNSQGQIDDMLDDCMEDAINKAERAMDRVTNEKMSAISEYSDTVMNDIHRNHDEVMFMYDMLNDSVGIFTDSRKLFIRNALHGAFCTIKRIIYGVIHHIFDGFLLFLNLTTNKLTNLPLHEQFVLLVHFLTSWQKVPQYDSCESRNY